MQHIHRTAKRLFDNINYEKRENILMTECWLHCILSTNSHLMPRLSTFLPYLSPSYCSWLRRSKGLAKWDQAHDEHCAVSAASPSSQRSAGPGETCVSIIWAWAFALPFFLMAPGTSTSSILRSKWVAQNKIQLFSHGMIGLYWTSRLVLLSHLNFIVNPQQNFENIHKSLPSIYFASHQTFHLIVTTFHFCYFHT